MLLGTMHLFKWNDVQTTIKLDFFISLGKFKALLADMYMICVIVSVNSVLSVNITLLFHM